MTAGLIIFAATYVLMVAVAQRDPAYASDRIE